MDGVSKTLKAFIPSRARISYCFWKHFSKQNLTTLTRYRSLSTGTFGTSLIFIVLSPLLRRWRPTSKRFWDIPRLWNWDSRVVWWVVSLIGSDLWFLRISKILRIDLRVFLRMDLRVFQHVTSFHLDVFQMI